MGSFIRFILSAPFAGLITLLIFLGLYNQLFPTTPRPADIKNVTYINVVETNNTEECPPRSDCNYQQTHKDGDEFGSSASAQEEQFLSSEKVAKQPPTLPTGCDESCAEIIIELDIPVPLKKEEGPGRLKYPQACLEKNLEGVVIVGFDITPEGRPTNIKIVQSPDNCFHQTALEMVSRWRYPIEVNAQGKPVWRYDQTTRIRFQLKK